MKKDELKKVLKPLIKECIKEVLLEEKGTLSHIISEVTSGLSVTAKEVVKENKQFNKFNNETKSKKDNNLNARRKKLLDSIGSDAYNGVNLFEGTTPAPAQSSGGRGPLSDVDGSDPGVDISNLFGNKSAAIYQKMMEKK